MPEDLALSFSKRPSLVTFVLLDLTIRQSFAPELAGLGAAVGLGGCRGQSVDLEFQFLIRCWHLQFRVQKKEVTFGIKAQEPWEEARFCLCLSSRKNARLNCEL